MKKRAKGKKRARRTKKGRRRSTRNKGFVVRYFPKGLPTHSPLPMEYFTKFTASAFYYTGTGAGTGDYQWSFKMNSIYQVFSSATTGVTYNTINPATQNVTAYSSMVNANMYRNWQVYGCKLELDVTPQAINDSVIFTITPSRSTTVPASAAAALLQPNTKQMGFDTGGRIRPNSDFPLKMYMPVHKYVGLDKKIFMNQLDSGGASTPYVGSITNNPTTVLYFNCWCETGDNQILNFPLEVRVRVTYYVRLFNLATENMT